MRIIDANPLGQKGAYQSTRASLDAAGLAYRCNGEAGFTPHGQTSAQGGIYRPLKEVECPSPV